MSTRVLAAILLIAPILALGQEEEGKADISYSFTVRPVKEVFLEGEPIVIIAEVKNTGKEAIEHIWFATVYFMFDVRDAEGKRLSTIPHVTPDGMTRGNGRHGMCSPRLKLEPGQTLQTRVEVLDGDPLRLVPEFRGQHVYTHPDYPDWRRFKRTLVPGKYTLEFRHLANIEGYPDKELDENDQWVGYHEDAATEVEIVQHPREEGPGYFCYMDLWSMVKKQDIELARERLASLKDKGRAQVMSPGGLRYEKSAYQDWGVYYFGRLCIGKEEWEEAEKTLAEVKDEESFPYHMEATYYYLLAKAEQGKLRTTDTDFLQFKKNTANYVLLPQLGFQSIDHRDLRRTEELELIINQSH